MAFITWRTADSLPAAALHRIATERAQLIARFGLDPNRDWQHELDKLPPADRGRLQLSLFEAWDGQLDRGAGECVLAREELSLMVADSLRRFEGERYELTDFVVMPNHVHVMAAFATEDALLRQCASWKRFTGRQLNEALGRRGEFWQVEQFDHLVRNMGQFEHYRKYIADNPQRARLAAGSYRHFSKDLAAT